MTDPMPIQAPDKIVRFLLSISVVLLFAIAGILAFHALDGLDQTWSYTIVAPKDDDLIKELNRAGAGGWEVVAARRATNGEGEKATASYELILKRRGATNIEPKLGDPIFPK